MAASIYGAAMLNSLAEGNDRNVLMALADSAGHDGVTWLTVGAGKNDVERTICRLARVSKSTALRSVAFLRDELGEIQTVKVRRGRSFTTVYRVLHGAQQVDYARIPFDVPHHFDEEPLIHGVKLTPSNANTGSVAATMRATEAPQVHGVNLTPSPREVHGVISDGFTVSAPRVGVNENRQENQENSSSSRDGGAAAALLDGQLADLNVSPHVRAAAAAEPERASAWLELAVTEAERNPAGFFVSGFTSGVWPSPRKRETPTDSRRAWVAETSWRLPTDFAHEIVDAWTDLDDVERQEFHELVDRERASRQEANAA